MHYYIYIPGQVEIVEPPVTGLLLVLAVGLAFFLLALIFWKRDE